MAFGLSAARRWNVSRRVAAVMCGVLLGCLCLASAGVAAPAAGPIVYRKTPLIIRISEPIPGSASTAVFKLHAPASITKVDTKNPVAHGEFPIYNHFDWRNAGLALAAIIVGGCGRNAPTCTVRAGAGSPPKGGLTVNLALNDQVQYIFLLSAKP